MSDTSNPVAQLTFVEGQHHQAVLSREAVVIKSVMVRGAVQIG